MMTRQDSFFFSQAFTLEIFPYSPCVLKKQRDAEQFGRSALWADKFEKEKAKWDEQDRAKKLKDLENNKSDINIFPFIEELVSKNKK